MDEPPALWHLTPDRADEWRAIRIEALELAPEAFDSTLADWIGRPLADFAARLGAVETWAAGDQPGQPLAVAGWERGWTPGTEDTGWITGAYVRPAARGKGLMAVLLDHLAARAHAAGMTRLALHVGLDNAPARACYRKAGFRDSGAPFVNGRGVTEIEMLRPLSDHDRTR